MDNFQKKIIAMIATGELTGRIGEVVSVGVYHDDSCGIWKDKICDCECEIIVTELDDVPAKVH